MKKVTLLLVSLLVFSVFLAGCGERSGQATNRFAKVATDKVGIDYSYNGAKSLKSDAATFRSKIADLKKVRSDFSDSIKPLKPAKDKVDAAKKKVDDAKVQFEKVLKSKDLDSQKDVLQAYSDAVDAYMVSVDDYSSDVDKVLTDSENLLMKTDSFTTDAVSFTAKAEQFTESFVSSNVTVGRD